MAEYHGRQKLTANRETDMYRILADNGEAINKNLEDSAYLYDYICGRQDVLERERPNKPGEEKNIVENRARQIVDFKVSYEFAFPVNYINKSGDEETKINVLNNLTEMDCQPAKHIELMEWVYATGAGYMGVFANGAYASDNDEIPYYTTPISSDKAFVVYSDDGKDDIILAGIKDEFTSDEAEYTRLQVYHENTLYKWVAEEIDFAELEELAAELPNAPGEESQEHFSQDASPYGIPIIEYPLNAARFGFIEYVKDLIDALNNARSNAVENIEDIVQAFLWLHGVTLGRTEEERRAAWEAIKLNGVLETFASDDVKTPIVKFMSQVLNQGDAKILKDDIIDAMLDIVGLPNRNMQMSQIQKTGAMLLGGGYQRAESMAQKTALYFMKPELKSVQKRLEILRAIALEDYDIGDLRLTDIGITTTRNPNLGIETKAMAYNMLMKAQAVSPEDAMELVGFADSNRLNRNRKEYWGDKPESEEAQNGEAENVIADLNIETD